MTVVPVEAFQSGVLNAQKHERLILDIDRYARRAGIAPQYIWTSAVQELSAPEVEYLQKCLMLAKNGTPGLVYEGAGDPSERMAIMAGALVRAFVDARLMPAMQVFEYVGDGEYPEATVLLIPNFHVEAATGKYDTKKIAALGDVLCKRAVLGLPTIIKIDNAVSAGNRFGQQVAGIMHRMETLQYNGE